jgi:RND family efflux transporter MFP subunit
LRLRLGGTSVTKSDVDKAVAQLAAAKAQADVSEENKKSAESALRTAELQLSYTDIRSPIAGRISRTLVTRGNLVGQTDTLLTTIVSIDPLHVYFDVPEKDWIEQLRLQKDQAKTSTPMNKVAIEIGVATEDGFPHVGMLDFSENRADTSTGTVRIRGEVPNPKVGSGQGRILYPGLFARVRVPTGDPTERFVIPEESLMTGQEGRYVFIVGADNVVSKRTVKLGIQVWRAPPPDEKEKEGPVWSLINPKPPASGDAATKMAQVRSLVAIEGGLKKDDRVIVNGLQKARPGAPVNPDVWDLRGPKPAN